MILRICWGWRKEPLSFTQHPEIFTEGLWRLGFFFKSIQEWENIEETRSATKSQMMKLEDVNIGVYQCCVFYFFILVWSLVIGSWKIIETKWKEMGSLPISTPVSTTNLRFHPSNTMAFPGFIQHGKADYTKAWEGLCLIPEYLYFFLAKASSYKPHPYMVADLFLFGRNQFHWFLPILEERGQSENENTANTTCQL